jgi:hypothetical protein
MMTPLTERTKEDVAMGIYLGQLPPAEIARLKAELAETLIANFCYPRFFDQRTQALRMRPVDRAKRQEVWLYLSGVDFTQWSRVDLLSPDFQVQIERLFIQFVQRNRAFFGEQGRRRMSDIRMLIGTAAGGVVQNLRGHLAGQKGSHPFGSPRPVMSWGVAGANGRTESSWEQISAATMTLQQQLQEIRGEIRPGGAPEARPAAPVARKPGARPGGESNGSGDLPPAPVVAASVAQVSVRPTAPVQGGRRVSAPLPQPGVPNTPAAATAAPVVSPSVRRPETPTATPVEIPTPTAPVKAVKAAPAESRKVSTDSPILTSLAAGEQGQARNGVSAQASESTLPAAFATGQGLISEDLAIFEQMRHQLIVWLRIEAITAGVEIAGLGPAQLLEALRQQERKDETRLQVVSSLLNLANQVIKSGAVSSLDYKQALMLHLMHTKR